MTDLELQDKIDKAKKVVEDLEMIQEGRIEVAEIEEELKKAKLSLAAREVCMTQLPDLSTPPGFHHTIPTQEPWPMMHDYPTVVPATFMPQIPTTGAPSQNPTY